MDTSADLSQAIIIHHCVIGKAKGTWGDLVQPCENRSKDGARRYVLWVDVQVYALRQLNFCMQPVTVTERR